jgi:Lar family restriction alleviation protein
MKLKPCPFCGGEAAMGSIKYGSGSEIPRLNGQSTFYGANCIVCGATTMGLVGAKTEDSAADRWNRRVVAKP